MTQTIRRKNCKTRREWAWNKSLKVWKGFRGGLIDYGERLLQAEHARAVRIVKRAKRLELQLAKALQFHGLRDTDTNEFLEGYEAACVDILAALSKGRA